LSHLLIDDASASEADSQPKSFTMLALSRLACRRNNRHQRACWLTEDIQKQSTLQACSQTALLVLRLLPLLLQPS
jgi:hypothetical protein